MTFLFIIFIGIVCYVAVCFVWVFLEEVVRIIRRRIRRWKCSKTRQLSKKSKN